MTRFLYRCLIQAYPRKFRERFADELLLTFDEVRTTHGSMPLLANAVATLFRQWTLRPVSASPTLATPLGPVFHVFEPRPLPPTAVLLGTTAALLLLGTVQYAIRNWSSLKPSIGALRGTFQPNASGIAIEQAVSGSVVTGGGTAADEWTLAAWEYIAHLPVLSAVDKNSDGRLSAIEILRAPDALRALDRDHNGSLSPKECGQPLGPSRLFMKSHPVHRALDANGDSIIGAEEIRGAALRLRTLDLSRDGQLHPAEFLPDETVRVLLERP